MFICFFFFFFFFSSRRRHTRFDCDWSSDVCSSDLNTLSILDEAARAVVGTRRIPRNVSSATLDPEADRKSTRLNSSHSQISYAVFCLKKKNIDVDTHCKYIPHTRAEDYTSLVHILN